MISVGSPIDGDAGDEIGAIMLGDGCNSADDMDGNPADEMKDKSGETTGMDGTGGDSEPAAELIPGMFTEVRSNDGRPRPGEAVGIEIEGTPREAETPIAAESPADAETAGRPIEADV